MVVRSRHFPVLPCVLFVLGALGCSGGSLGSSKGPCEGPGAPASCGTACSASMPCPTGQYCDASGQCTADCSASMACPSGQTCTADGRCMAAPVDAGPPVDASNLCADRHIAATRVTPNVILIVDQSGSMTSTFSSSGSRWDVLRNSLLAIPDGFIYAMQDQVRFGLDLYSAQSGGGATPLPGTACPMITSVPFALHNYDAIQAVYGPADPIEDTPTGAAIEAVLATVTSRLDPGPDPTIFILATDGEPDTCMQLNPQNGQAQALTGVQDAYAAGIKTFVISVGSELSVSHLQQMANAGAGVAAGMPDAPYWVAGNDAGLRDALRTIIGGQLSCDVTLDGHIDPSMACTGTVKINGTVIPCGDPNGWHALDETHIELSGDACTMLQSSPGVTLDATFPCAAIII